LHERAIRAPVRGKVCVDQVCRESLSRLDRLGEFLRQDGQVRQGGLQLRWHLIGQRRVPGDVASDRDRRVDSAQRPN